MQSLLSFLEKVYISEPLYYIWMSISICSFIFVLLVFGFFLAKLKQRVPGYKEFLYLMISCVLFNISAFWLLLTKGEDHYITMRIFLALIITVFYSIFIYLSYITYFNESNKLKNIYKKIYVIVSSVAGLIFLSMFFLPLNIVRNDNLYYPEGLALNVLFIFGITLFISLFVILILNRKSFRKYGVLVLVYGSSLIALAIQALYPEVYLTSFALNFIVICIYHSIDFNNTLDLYNDYNLNKIENEKRITSINNSLNEYSLSIKNSLHSILGLVNTINYNDNNDIKYNSEMLNSECSKLYNILQSVINLNKDSISSFENVKYNFYNEIHSYFSFINSNDLFNNIKLSFNVDVSLNKLLYGDISKIKKMIYMFLCFCVDNYQNGNINIDMNSKNESGKCILLFNVMLDSNFIDYSNLLKLMNNDTSSTYINNTNANLFVRILKLFNGNISINDKCLCFSIPQEFYVNDNNDSNISYVYGNDNYSNKNIVIVESDGIKNNILKKYLSKYVSNVLSFSNVADYFNNINSGIKYDSIFINSKLLSDEDIDKLLTSDFSNIVIINNDYNIDKVNKIKQFNNILELPFNDNDIKSILDNVFNNK